MIGIVSEIVESMIKFEVKSAKYFSIQCDEVTSHKRAFIMDVISGGARGAEAPPNNFDDTKFFM